MAVNTYIPDMPYFPGLIVKNQDGSYDYTKVDEAFNEWLGEYNKAIRDHNKQMKKPFWFRLLTGYKNPKEIKGL
jgi:hypothetical protein